MGCCYSDYGGIWECVGTGIPPEVPALNNGALHSGDNVIRDHAPSGDTSLPRPELAQCAGAARNRGRWPQGGPGVIQTAITWQPVAGRRLKARFERRPAPARK